MLLFAGTFADRFNRVLLLGIFGILWSLTSIGTAFIEVFWQMLALRVLLGIFEAFQNPVAYGLIVDFFPQEKRTTANAFYSFGVYIGAALSSISILLVGWIGWRESYFFVGIFGITIALLTFFLVKEPLRGRYELATEDIPKIEIKKTEVQEEEEVETKPI